MLDSMSESRLALVCPALATKVEQMADILASDIPPVSFRVTQGLRSWNEQAALYAQGRTTPGRIVTDAPAGYSQHCFGMAVDIVPMDAHNIPDWDNKHPTWARIIKVGESLGLIAGAEFRTFPDYPHFQLTGRWPITPDDEERQTFLDGGMQAVWKESGLPSMS